jgi:hypothetical protein
MANQFQHLPCLFLWEDVLVSKLCILDLLLSLLVSRLLRCIHNIEIQLCEYHFLTEEFIFSRNLPVKLNFHATLSPIKIDTSGSIGPKVMHGTWP